MKSTELKNDLQNIEKYQEARKQEYDDSLYVCVHLTLVRSESFRRRKGKKGVARRERKRKVMSLVMLQRLFFCLSVTSRLGIRHKKGKQPRRTLQAPSAAGSPPPPSPVPPEPSCEEDAPSPRPPRSVREQVRARPSHRSGAQVCTEKRRRGELSAAGKRAVCGPRARGVRPIGPAGPPVCSARLSHFSKEDRRFQRRTAGLKFRLALTPPCQ